MSRGSVAILAATVALTLCAGGLVPSASGSRILAVEAFAAKSHWNVMSSVLRALTDGGHSVTVFTMFPEGDRDNYTEVNTAGSQPMKLGLNVTDVLELFDGATNTAMPLLMKLNRRYCDSLLQDERFVDVLERRLRADFDAIVLETFAVSHCGTYPAAGSGLPVIFVDPLPIAEFAMARYTFGDVPNPAVVSSMMSRHAVPKSFGQRFTNTFISLYNAVCVTYMNFLYETFDPKPYDMVAPVRPSVAFVNSHFISDAARPIPSNVVNVGGIHLKPAKKIPQDVLEFIENAPHGVILFTFGSTIAMSSMPKNIQNIFLEVLAQLPQRVLLKYEKKMENKPKNVMTSKWFPQRDILLHPNVKLFISHGGISGVYEAVDAGVPVLGFPLVFDQHRNIDNLVEAGMAISMEFVSLTKDTFSTNVAKLLNDKKYMKNAKITSDIFKDRPMSPAQSVRYWTEYVIRHKGAPHLKSHALKLTWYQYYLLDVIAVVFSFICIAMFILWNVFTFFKKYISKYSKTYKAKSE